MYSNYTKMVLARQLSMYAEFLDSKQLSIILHNKLERHGRVNFKFNLWNRGIPLACLVSFIYNLVPLLSAMPSESFTVYTSVNVHPKK